jgi:hypothetical protein
MNLTITSTTNSIRVDVTGGDPFGVWRKDKIIAFTYKGSYIEVKTQDQSFEIAHTATVGCFTVDTVNGAAPSSLTDLFSKLAALVA